MIHLSVIFNKETSKSNTKTFLTNRHIQNLILCVTSTFGVEPHRILRTVRRFGKHCCYHTFTLNMAIEILAETLDNSQNSTYLNPESRSYTLNSSCKNLKNKNFMLCSNKLSIITNNKNQMHLTLGLNVSFNFTQNNLSHSHKSYFSMPPNYSARVQDPTLHGTRNYHGRQSRKRINIIIIQQSRIVGNY